jgi:3,4-dihydroxy-2-butanone 4-phosphate synthase
MKNNFDEIESIIADLKRGKMVIVVDDADRENDFRRAIWLREFTAGSSDRTFAGHWVAR